MDTKNKWSGCSKPHQVITAMFMHHSRKNSNSSEEHVTFRFLSDRSPAREGHSQHSWCGWKFQGLPVSNQKDETAVTRAELQKKNMCSGGTECHTWCSLWPQLISELSKVHPCRHRHWLEIVFHLLVLWVIPHQGFHLLVLWVVPHQVHQVQTCRIRIFLCWQC